MDTNKKVTFNNTTMLTTSECASINQDDNNKLVKDIQNKIHQILQGKTKISGNYYHNKLKCRVPLYKLSDKQKLCTTLEIFKKKYRVDQNDQQKQLNQRLLKSYRFTSLASKQRLTRASQNSESPKIKGKISEQKQRINKIFGSEWQEYQNIYDLHNLLCPNSLDMTSAHAEVEFIKSKIKNENFYQSNNNNKKISTHNKTVYIDSNEVYSVFPNRPLSSRVILKKDGSDRPKSQRVRFSFRD